LFDGPHKLQMSEVGGIQSFTFIVPYHIHEVK
jgi:hypothetical protein